MAKKPVERRKYRRVKARVQVTLQKHDPDKNDFPFEEGRTKNLSLGGMLVHHDKLLEVPSYVIVTFSLPGSEKDLDFVGKAVRIEELSDGSYEVGIMFMRMILGEFDKLDQYISEETNSS